MIPTSAQQNTLKSRPQRTKAWLSIYKPNVAMAAQVNDATITKGEREITYDGVTSGSYSLVEPNFIMLVGTAAGKADKGRVRVKSITSSVVTVAENSHINWGDDDYITILRYVEIVPIFTRIIQNPANELDVIFYKDYDIAYSNQNSILGASVNMGCHYAGFLNITGSCPVYYSASGTSHLVTGTTLSYSWWFQGATTTGSALANPGYIDYTTPGQYVTRLIVSGSNGSVDTAYRFISIYDHPSRGTNVPILKWSMTDLSGSREAGGYKTTIKIEENVPVETIRDGALVVIFTEDYYNNVETSIGGNALNRSSIRFVGYIIDGTINFNYREGWVEFDVESPTGVMQKSECFSVSVESKASPSKWYELLNMNCQRALYHYLRWHSTVLQVCDFEFPSTDYNIQYFDADRTSLYGAINNFVDGTLWGSVVCDRQGKIWVETNYDAYSDGGTLPSNMTLEDHDIMGTLTIDERETGETAYIEMGGIKYDNPTAGTFTAFLCGVPGVAPSYQGKVERIQGLALLSQTHLNTLAGNIFAHRNSRYPSIDANLAGNYTNFDIAPQELAVLNTSSSLNNRQVAFSNKKFAITSCTLKYDAKELQEFVSLGLAEVVEGVAADTIVIPAIPPTNSGGDPPLPNPFPPGGITPGIINYYFAIYHNDVFVGNANALNFLDSDYSTTGT